MWCVQFQNWAVVSTMSMNKSDGNVLIKVFQLFAADAILVHYHIPTLFTYHLGCMSLIVDCTKGKVGKYSYFLHGRKGWPCFPFWMNFRKTAKLCCAFFGRPENLQRNSFGLAWPPPFFRKFIVFTPPKLPKKPQRNFLDRKWPPPPFGSFPKIHPKWSTQSSLSHRKNMITGCTFLLLEICG